MEVPNKIELLLCLVRTYDHLQAIQISPYQLHHSFEVLTSGLEEFLHCHQVLVFQIDYMGNPGRQIHKVSVQLVVHSILHESHEYTNQQKSRSDLQTLPGFQNSVGLSPPSRVAHTVFHCYIKMDLSILQEKDLPVA